MSADEHNFGSNRMIKPLRPSTRVWGQPLSPEVEYDHRRLSEKISEHNRMLVAKAELKRKSP